MWSTKANCSGHEAPLKEINQAFWVVGFVLASAQVCCQFVDLERTVIVCPVWIVDSATLLINVDVLFLRFFSWMVLIAH